MTKKELKELIDLEVSKVFSDMVYKEPKEEPKKEPQTPVMQKRKSLTEEELDEILFYKEKEKKEN